MAHLMLTEGSLTSMLWRERVWWAPWRTRGTGGVRYTYTRLNLVCDCEAVTRIAELGFDDDPFLRIPTTMHRRLTCEHCDTTYDLRIPVVMVESTGEGG